LHAHNSQSHLVAVGNCRCHRLWPEIRTTTMPTNLGWVLEISTSSLNKLRCPLNLPGSWQPPRSLHHTLLIVSLGPSPLHLDSDALMQRSWPHTSHPKPYHIHNHVPHPQPYHILIALLVPPEAAFDVDVLIDTCVDAHRHMCVSQAIEIGAVLDFCYANLDSAMERDPPLCMNKDKTDLGSVPLHRSTRAIFFGALSLAFVPVPAPMQARSTRGS
jgi:hypothetical protein